MTWHDIGEPLLIHTEPNQPPDRQYGVCTVLVPALGARLTINGNQARGTPWKREREGRPFSTCALAFSESWTRRASSLARNPWRGRGACNSPAALPRRASR